MHIPAILQERFATALADMTDQPEKYAQMIRGTNDASHGDYQANCAMPLSKQQAEKSNPREVAESIVAALKVDDFCEPAKVAGPGFINLTVKDSFLESKVAEMLGDERCLVSKSQSPKNIVIDFSSPNVAKPMHVGHIRSTVIGDSLARTLSFLGHNVVTDNHLGDWGTQFGIIIYGYKHFGDPSVVKQNPIPELAKLYRKVNQLIEYRKAVKSIDKLQADIALCQERADQAQLDVDAADTDKKKKEKALKAAVKKLAAAKQTLKHTNAKIALVDDDPETAADAKAHSTVDKDVLQETVKLHAGDKENLALWHEFLPHCKDEINRIYDRLNVTFDHTLGESFYHSMLADVVTDLQKRGLAKDSDGAVCVFLDSFDAPMIVQKQDGAFLYATTDLATLKYRLDEFAPDEILYVVDSRQSEHFDKLFEVAKLVDLDKVKLVHVNFGTVLGEDGRPMKTRSGTLVGLEGLLNDAVAGAATVVCNPERLARMDPPMDDAEQVQVAETIGIAAIKYADLAHHRASDYRFSLKKMVATDGNTATYIQYSFARTQSILKRVGATPADIQQRVEQHGIKFTQPAERALAMMLVKLEEALVNVHEGYAPNQLVEYLYGTAKAYATFNDDEHCHVINASTTEIQTTRLALVTLCGRVLELGLSLLGIQVVSRM